MFVMRLVFNNLMYYFAGFDVHPEDHSKDTMYWARLGNKIQSFVDEDSAIRAMEQMKEGFFHYIAWDDSDAKIAKASGTEYVGQALEMTSWSVQIIDLTDMVICREMKARAGADLMRK